MVAYSRHTQDQDIIILALDGSDHELLPLTEAN